MNSEEIPAIDLTRLAGFKKIASGKVREVYQVDDRTLLIVATDRISAFDCILPDPIPRKGEVLTQMSVFWFEFLKTLTPTHFVTSDYARDGWLAGRSMLVRHAQMYPVECVARGYLAGSGWREYRETGMVCGIRLPTGLRDGDALSAAIFTPATKAQSGHDENISFERMSEMLGANVATRLRDLTLAIYAKAAAHALERGIIVGGHKVLSSV